MKVNNKTVTAVCLGLGIFLVSPQAANAEILYCQGMVCSTTPPTPQEQPTAAFAIVDENNKVVNTIVGSLNHFGNNDQTVSNSSECLSACRIVLQAPSDPGSFNASGYASNGSTVVTYNEARQTFEGSEGETLTKVIFAPETATVGLETTTVTTMSINFGPLTESGTVSTTISAKVIANNSANSVTTNDIYFEMAQTEQVVRNAAARLSIISSRIERLLTALNGWLL